MTQLELAFETRLLRELCENESKATEVLGAAVANTLQRRLADLRAASTIKDVIVGRKAADEKSDPHVSLDLSKDIRIVFGPNHKRIPTLTDGSTDWSRVTRIKITKIGECQ